MGEDQAPAGATGEVRPEIDPLEEAVEVLAAKVVRAVEVHTGSDPGELAVLLGLVERVRALRSSKPVTLEVRERPEVRLDEGSSFRLVPGVGDPGDLVRVEPVSSGAGGGRGRLFLHVRDGSEKGPGHAAYLSLAEWDQIDSAARQILAGGGR
jgi:hypothetical protein